MINSFFRSLWDFGILRIIRSWDFLLSIVFCTLSFILKNYHNIELSIDFQLAISILIALFAFVFAALAIVISLSDEKFLKLLKQKKVLRNLLFHYWYACVIYLVSTILTYTLMLYKIDNNFSFVALFLLIYSLLLTIELVKTTISFGYYREMAIE